MPLPAALLAKLQKRGIVKAVNEEVIAESYDSNEGKEKRNPEECIGGAPGCPNRYNPYHSCSDYCYDHWQEGFPEPRLDDTYLRRKARMLARYPLPEGWVEVYDGGMARHYYWNQDTDEVSWLSPRHPRAQIGEAAPQIAKQYSGGQRTAVAAPERDETRRGGDREESRDSRRDRDYDSRDRGRDRGGDRDRRNRRRRDDDDEGGNVSDDGPDLPADEMSERDRLKRAKRRGIDPMDPAAYGDAPVGKWSSGLVDPQKTGADVTASGPLFQQRPYPAPGAILRAQKKAQGGDDDEDM